MDQIAIWAEKRETNKKEFGEGWGPDEKQSLHIGEVPAII